MSDTERAAMMILARGLTPSLRRHLREVLEHLSLDEGGEEIDQAEMEDLAGGAWKTIRRRERYKKKYAAARTDEERERILDEEAAELRASIERGENRTSTPSLRTIFKRRATRTRKRAEREAAKAQAPEDE